MDKITQKNRVASVREYLAGIGHPVGQTQAYEILARALGHKNKHVLASSVEDATVAPNESASKESAHRVFMPGDKPLSVQEMRAMGWQFDVVIPVPLDLVPGSELEATNDYASSFITGDMCALEDIQYAHVVESPYPDGFLAFNVRGHVSSPADFFDEEAEYQDALFDAHQVELASRLRLHAKVILSHPTGYASTYEVVYCDEGRMSLLAQKDTPHEEWVEACKDLALELVDTAKQSFEDDGLMVYLPDLNTSFKQEDGAWQFYASGEPFKLRFIS